MLGTIIKKGGNSITVNNPLEITYIQRTSGPPSVSLQRYIPFTSQENITFDWSHVETICEPIQGMPEYYENALKVIKEHIDPSLVTDLMDANEGKQEKPSYDAYLAMLEKYMSKKPLN